MVEQAFQACMNATLEMWASAPGVTICTSAAKAEHHATAIMQG